jgi:hypothetical protein
MKQNLLAQIVNPALPSSIGNNSDPNAGGKGLGMLIGNIVGAIMIIAFLLAFFYLMTGGVQWLTSGGEKAQLENARNKIIHAIIGLIIIAAVWAVMNIVGPFLGLNFPNLNLPSITP